MLRTRARRVVCLMLGGSFALLLAVGLFGTAAKGRDEKAALPAEQAIACIRTAVASKPGDVRAVEMEKEEGKTLCEVEVVAADGKTYEIEIDSATNTVIEVEEDND